MSEVSKQPRIYLSPPDVGPPERARLLEAFDSNWIAPVGPHVDAFEAELATVTQVQAAAALSSGTAALHLALRLLDIQPEDRVWTASLTFAATANAIRYMGGTPLFIDSERTSWNVDPALLAQALQDANKKNKLPKALITVDLYGQCADYEPILNTCKKYDVPIIEDAAEALGATYRGKPAGSFGQLSALSFNGNKIITTSGGGALLGNDITVIERARFLASQAKESCVHYEHKELGYNYRLSNLLAALGLAQLQRLDTLVERRRQNRSYYIQTLGTLPGVEFMPEAPHCRSTFWLTSLLVDPAALGVSREQICTHLLGQNIEARPVWKPMHLQPLYRHAEMIGGEVSADLFNRGMCLPSGSGLDQASLGRVVEAFMSTPGLRSN